MDLTGGSQAEPVSYRGAIMADAVFAGD